MSATKATTAAWQTAIEDDRGRVSMQNALIKVDRPSRQSYLCREHYHNERERMKGGVICLLKG